MKRYFQGIPLLWALIILLAAGSTSAALAAPLMPTQVQSLGSHKHVLVINSFHEGYHWTDRIMQGVNSVFDKEEEVELVITYLDAKRCSAENYFEQLRDLYAYKYRFHKFDAIVSTDDHALNFLLKYRDELFPKVPVFFCGINDFKPSRIEGHDGFTGVYETSDAVGTLDLMLQLHPGVRKVAIISDATLAGDDWRRHVELAEPRFTGRVEFEYLDNPGWNELNTKLGMLSKDSLVLWAMYLRTPEGVSISSEESVRMVTQASGLPTYCIWDVVGQGVVGGKVTSPIYQGKSAAEMAMKVLRGGRVQELAVSGSPMIYLFDYHALERFNISPSTLPQGSMIMNRPFSPYEEYKQAIWLVLSFIALLIVVIILLTYYIRKLRQAEAATQESEERYRLLSMRTGHLVYDYNISSGNIICSGAIEAISGFTPEEFQHINIDEWKERIHEDHREKVLELLDKGLKNASHYKKIEYLIRRKDESFIYIEDSGAFLRNKEGKPYRILGSIMDISDRKRAEQEREKLQDQLTHLGKMESIGNLAGGIAHDFNNILSPIIGMSELLLLDTLPGTLEHDNAQKILKAGTRGRDLVKQILTFSRQTEHKMEPVQILQILEEVLKLGRSTIPADIEISQDIQTDCGVVRANPTQVHQIAMNLITNAYHAVESTVGKIHIQLKETEWEGNGFSNRDLDAHRYALLSISDNGCGIPSGVINKIFDPYFTTKESGKGTGLGLSVVHGIVKEHKGDIKVYSEIGKGTTFHVYLPLIKKPIQNEPAKKIKNHPIGDERILLVDDDEGIVGVVNQMLQRLGYRVTSFTNSIDAVDAFRLNPDTFDLVLTDMNMPNMTGEQLAQELITIRPDIPILIWTGANDRINEKKIKNTGIKSILMKPVGMSELAETLRKVLDDANGDN